MAHLSNTDRRDKLQMSYSGFSFLKTRNQRLIAGLILLSGFLFSTCQNESLPSDEPAFLNWNDSVFYVGMETCRSCHGDKHETFIHTGMGQSWDLATKQKSKAVYDHSALVYDTASNFWYRPFWKNDSLFFKEFRIEGQDTVFQRTEHIAYIIGSGQHTNSHLVNFDGYLYQAPITFYTQKGKWDLAPGFDKGHNSRFSRIIGHECITCHNAFPEFEKSSENKYHKIPQGIDCERCHGPGSLHVSEKRQGKLLDTRTEADRTIVNPARLSRDRQMDLCMRCHLQGVAVLLPGKSYEDFLPGMKLRDFMQIFLPRFDGTDDEFIMASQADRLMLSKCYQLSEMSCLSCHNPHVSVKATPVSTFNEACTNCHQKGEPCLAPVAERLAKNNNCSGCHMPQSGSIDIPHVSITDHKIQRPEGHLLNDETVAGIRQFIRLECLTESKPSPEEMARGYLALYERFSQRQVYLDSAGFFLQIAKNATIDDRVHYHFLKQNNTWFLALSDTLVAKKLTNGWTAYRIADRLDASGKIGQSLPFYQKATELKPFYPDFRNKLAATHARLGQADLAEKEWLLLIKEQPRFKEAWINYGFLTLQNGNFSLADSLLQVALSLDPDYEKALLNLAELHIRLRNREKAKSYLQRLNVLSPASPQVEILWREYHKF